MGSHSIFHMFIPYSSHFRLLHRYSWETEGNRHLNRAGLSFGEISVKEQSMPWAVSEGQLDLDLVLCTSEIIAATCLSLLWVYEAYAKVISRTDTCQ